MSYDRVTAMDARHQIGRLESAGYRLPDAGAERVAAAWVEALDGVAAEDLADAVTSYIQGTSSYWPKPGALRGLAIDARRDRLNGGQGGDLKSRYLAWEQSHEGGCPVCGAVMQIVQAGNRGVPDTAAGRYGVIHDYGEHARKRVAHVGYPYPPEEERHR